MVASRTGSLNQCDAAAPVEALRALVSRLAPDLAALRAMVASTAGPAALLDAGGLVIEANEALRELLGLAAGCDWFTAVRSSRRTAEAREAYRAALAAGERVAPHWQRFDPLGYLRIAWSYVVCPGRPGATAVVLGTATRESPWDADSILNAAGDAIFVADSDGRFVVVNDRAAALVEMPREALIGRPFVSVLKSAELAARPLDAATLSRDGVVVRERTVVTPAGEEIPVEVCVSTLGAGYLQAIVRDLRPRALQLSDRIRSERLLRTVIEHLPDVVVVHREGKVVYANPAAERAWSGDETPDLVGRAVLDLVHPEDHAAVVVRVRQMMTLGVPSPVRHERLMRRNGNVMMAEVVAIPIDFDGARCVMAVARDVTEPMALRARLAQADRMASVGLLAAGVAHEVNNPLTYTLLNLERLAGAVPDALHAGWAIEAAEGVRRVQKIVLDLRSFARAEEGDRVPLDLSRVLDAALQLSASEYRFRAKIVRDGLTARDEAVVIANEGRLLQVFVNLLVNASHALDDRGPEHNQIAVTLERRDAWVMVSVRDTGHGIRPENMTRLFEPFFTTKPLGKGSGLGLWVCHNIVTSLGGTIQVQSEPGQGSTFTVSLPAADAGTRAATPPPTFSMPPPRPNPEVTRRLLVVDDEPMILSTLKPLLEFQGFAVDTAATGLKARDLIAEGREYAAILCDLMMPEMSGIDLFRWLAANAPETARRMIFLTGGAFTEEAARFLAETQNPTVMKPFELHELVAAIDDRVEAER